MTNDELIAEAEKLAAKASPGPWNVQLDHEDEPYEPITNEWAILTQEEIPHVEPIIGLQIGDKDNAEFMAQARTLLPELARRLKAVTDELHQQKLHNVDLEHELERADAMEDKQ